MSLSLLPSPAQTILVYRDRIVPRSEAHFLRRLYLGFDTLSPVWVGCRLDDGLADLGYAPLILGRPGPWGAVERSLFKQFGVLPRQPDLSALAPKLVHAHFGRGGALALPMARALRIPLVVTFHGGDATKHTHYRRRLVPAIYQRRLVALQSYASLFICVSDFIRDRLLGRGFPPDKLKVIRYGIELPAPAPAATPTGDPYLLFVGRFVEKKGITHLIEAVRRLRQAGVSVRLVLIGDGQMAETLKRQADGLDEISFKGWLPQGEVQRWMRGATALCVPSVTAGRGDEEGLPNVVLEAMAMGTPVVGSRHAGIGEAVVDGETGLLVPSGDAAPLAAALRILVEAPAAARAMGDRARVRAERHFNAMTQSSLIQDTLAEIIRRAR